MNKDLLDYYSGDEFCAGVWKRKYKNGETERTPDYMHRRLATEFARIEEKYYEQEYQDTAHPDGKLKHLLSDYGQKRDWLDEEAIYELYKNFKYISPQGRVMAGLGVKESYRSLSNCLRLPPPKDSYSSIMYSDTMLVSAAKRGCGYGLGLSNLRPDSAFVSNAANTSTGAPSFMSRYSNSTREVAQKGRRGACLLDMSIFHPDILQFITIKKDRTKVTGANISVKLYDEFMEAVEKDEDFILRWPCDLNQNFKSIGKSLKYNVLEKATAADHYYKKIRAKEYWDEIIENAWDNAEPGLFFWDRVLQYDPSTVYSKYYIDGTNACGEQPMAVYDTCRLILLNLYSFVKNPFKPNAEIDYDMLYKVSYEQMRLGDDLVDLEIEYIDRILGKIHSDELPDEEKAIELALWNNVRDMAKSGRRVGCGITALADMLAAANLKYDKSIDVIQKVMKTKMKGEIDANIDLAILRGPFEGWDPNLEFPGYGANDFYQMMLDEFPEETKKMCKYGRRSVNWSTIAPAGSTSIIAKTEDYPNMSAGCEPQFMCYFMRSQKINPDDKNVRIDYTDQNGDSWQEFPVVMGGFKQFIKNNWGELGLPYSEDPEFEQVELLTKEQIENCYKQSPYYMATANDIDWIERVKIQGVLQRYTTSAISSTLNLPKDVSKKTVSDIYFAGWKEGVKGITIYRDGCRTGVLNAESTKDQFEYKDAVKRPKELKAHAYFSTSKGKNYHVIVGLLQDKPYEIFIDNSDNKYSSEGRIVKEGRGKYVFKNGGDPIDIRAFMTDEQEAITRLVSSSLRHGANVKFIVEQLQKTPGDMFSFTKALARVLKKYIPDGEKSSVTCEDCGSTNVKFQEGCSTCMECGSSKCG